METVEMNVTCDTVGCMNTGITIQVTAPVGNDIFICGACGIQIINIQSVNNK